MAKFLNTPLLSEWIGKLIDETEKELIILAPYINISDDIFYKLLNANSRGVETVIIYRENKLNDKVRERLSSLDNLNLLHHPNLHAKCYYNEKYLIIGSMNLYEYSEKNNREMGVLLHKCDVDCNDAWGNADDEQIFKDAIDEIREIIKASEMEKPARDTIENGFELDIIKTDFEKTLEFCQLQNKYFINKLFEPVSIDGNLLAYCKNYYDRIDVSIDYRITIYFSFPEYMLQNIYSNFSNILGEFMYPAFKFCWNRASNKAYIYKDSKHDLWITGSDEEKFEAKKRVLANFFNDIKPLLIIK